MTATICRVAEQFYCQECGTRSRPECLEKHPSKALDGRSEWLRNVLAHCDRAHETSLATMRALGKSSSKVRRAVAK